ncbi:MAG: radical SAM protein [Treponemataceae bacterium]|nr:radical SAM protein [Treponemataceae bacterium]
MKRISVTVATVLVEKSPQALPLGAACIASYLKEQFRQNNFEADVKLADFTLEDEISPESVAQSLLASCEGFSCAAGSYAAADSSADFFLFSVFVWNRNLLCKSAVLLKKLYHEKYGRDCILIAGGPEVTANPKSDFPFDYLISGEGEKATSDLILELIGQNLAGSENSDPRTKIESRIHFGRRMKLAELPSPYLDGTIDLSRYNGGALWELARGCPFKCSYCYESKGEKTVDYFPLERLKKELDYFEKSQVAQIWVLDPTYNASKQRALEMLDYISKKAPDIFFHFECRAEFLDKELVRAFSKIDCCLQIGLQSADENVLRLVNRPFNRKNFVQKIALLNETGLIFGFDLIYGLPGDTLHGFEQSINFSLGLYPNHLELFRLSVLPGTDLFDRAGSLNLEFEPKPPYNVISTDKFSSSDLAKAERLSKSCNLFYSQGRAVPWFNSLLHLLKMQSVPFFYKFADFLVSSGKSDILDSYCCKHKEIEQLQLQFVRSLLKEKQLEKYTDLVCDIILLNGAYSRLYSDGETTALKLHYHPDDLLSEYAQDIRYFFQNAKKGNFTFKVANR